MNSIIRIIVDQDRIALTLLEQKLIDVRGNVAEVVLELPQTLNPDTGEVVIFNNKVWRGLYEGESENYPVGTPIPIQGYWDWTGAINQAGLNNPTLSNIKSDIGELTASRVDEGIYRILNDRIKNSDICLSTNITTTTKAITIEPKSSGAFEISHRDFSGNVEDGFNIFLNLKIYP